MQIRPASRPASAEAARRSASAGGCSRACPLFRAHRLRFARRRGAGRRGGKGVVDLAGPQSIRGETAAPSSMASAAHASRAAPTSNSNYLAQIDVATSLQKESLALDARIKVARAKAELYDKTLASLSARRTNTDKIASRCSCSPTTADRDEQASDPQRNGLRHLSPVDKLPATCRMRIGPFARMPTSGRIPRHTRGGR